MMGNSQTKEQTAGATVAKSAEAKTLVDEIDQVAKLINDKSKTTMKIADVRNATVKQRFINSRHPKPDRLVFHCVVNGADYVVKVQRIDLAPTGATSLVKRPPNYANELRALLRLQDMNITPKIHLAFVDDYKEWKHQVPPIQESKETSSSHQFIDKVLVFVQDLVLEARTINDLWRNGTGARQWNAQLQIYIAQMHQVGIAHGDLHANNVLVDRDGKHWIIDFGNCVLADPVAFRLHGADCDFIRDVTKYL